MIFKGFIIFLNLIYLSLQSELPSFVHKCKLTSPKEMEKCVLNQVPKVLSNLKDGYTPFKIPPLEPLSIPSLDMDLSDDFIVKMKDLKIEGLTTANIKKFSPEIENGTIKSIEIELNIPKLVLKGWYSINGYVMIVNVDGKGLMEIEISDLNVNMKMNVTTDLRNDVEYYQIPRDFDVDIRFGKVHSNFEDLMPDPEMTEKINDFLNEQSDMMFEIIKPGVIKTVRTISHEIFIKLLMYVPVKNFFEV